jgi:hypothetical protein
MGEIMVRRLKSDVSKSIFNTNDFLYSFNNYQTINLIIIPYAFNHKY